MRGSQDRGSGCDADTGPYPNARLPSTVLSLALRRSSERVTKYIRPFPTAHTPRRPREALNNSSFPEPGAPRPVACAMRAPSLTAPTWRGKTNTEPTERGGFAAEGDPPGTQRISGQIPDEDRAGFLHRQDGGPL